MFFDDISRIEEIARRVGTSIFVVPDVLKVEIKNAIVIEPENKTKITIEQVRGVIGRLNTKQVKDVFVLVRPAEKMNLEAQNAFLKALEEPGDLVHFVLVVNSLSGLLPTIISRSSVFFLKQVECDFSRIDADEKIKAMAKRMVAARPGELVGIAEELTKKKTETREYALGVIAVAIELLYKTYLLTGKSAFLLKLDKFIKLYDNILQNGHIKLHLVADLC